VLSKYLQLAMRSASYEEMEDGAWFGEIPGFEGLWASAPDRGACQTALEDSLGDWLIFSFKRAIDVPIVEGIDLNVRESA